MESNRRRDAIVAPCHHGTQNGVRIRAWSLLFACLWMTAGSTAAAPLLNPANGHYYEAVPLTRGITWGNARAAAQAMKHEGLAGHLATITSDEENQFIVTHFREAARGSYWLGGFQERGIEDPAAGWQWVTGEPWSYTNWNNIAYQEPNDAFGPGTSDRDENALQFLTTTGGRWNDAPASQPTPFGYVVEYEPEAIAGTPRLTAFTLAERGEEAVSGARPGALLRITGTDLGPGGTVLFSGIPLPATVARWSPTEILLWVPTAPSYPFPSRVTVAVDSKRVEGGEFTIAAPTAADNLLANGSFELPESDTGPADGGFAFGIPLDPDPAYYRGAAIPGWRIPRGAVELIGAYWQQAPEQGRQSIDLGGAPGPALIEQSFYTQPGRQYLFSGWISHHPGAPLGRANFYLNGELWQRLAHTVSASRTRMNWTPFEHRFRATERQTTLHLQDVTFWSHTAGAALDGLSLTLVPN